MSLLKTLSKKKRDALTERIKAELTEAQEYYEETIEPEIIRRARIYDAAKSFYRELFPRLSKKSEARSFDVRNVIEWMLPDMMKAFFADDSVVTVSAKSDEDWQRAVKTRKLLNHQLQVLNRGFTVFSDWLEEALYLNIGAVKLYWERTAKAQQRELFMSRENLAMLTVDPDVEIRKVTETETDDIVHVVYVQRSYLKNQPVLENVPISELRWTPWAKTLGADVPMIAQHIPVTVDLLRRREKAGVYENVEQAIKDAPAAEYTEFELERNPKLHDETAYEEAAKRLHIDEVYLSSDIDGDGVMEPIVATMCNGMLIRLDKNRNGRHPFFWLSTYKDPYKVFGDTCFADIIGEWQHFKTAIFRQISVNLSLNNDPRTFINGNSINHDDLLKDKQWVRVNGNPRECVFPQPVQPLAQWTMPFLEIIERHIEQLSGRSRIMRGQGEGAKTDTATGMQLLFDAGDAKLNAIIRRFAETDGGVVDMMRHLIKLNTLYGDQRQVVRLLNEPIEVTMDDLEGNFDLVVHAGVGIGEKEQRFRALQIYLAQIFPMALQLQQATPQHYAKAGKELLKISGMESPDDYFIPEQEGMMPGVPGFPGVQQNIPTAQAGGAGGDLSGLPPEVAGRLGGGAYPIAQTQELRPR